MRAKSKAKLAKKNLPKKKNSASLKAKDKNKKHKTKLVKKKWKKPLKGLAGVGTAEGVVDKKLDSSTSSVPSITPTEVIEKPKIVSKTTEPVSLREKMLKRLEAAKFRLVNEELDSGAVSSDPKSVFNSSLTDFVKYHETYRERISSWPTDPLSFIIRFIHKKMKRDSVIADFGCGEGRLAASLPHHTRIHSFDLFSANERVTECDMSNVPLENNSVDLAIFCLSLMGTDVGKYIAEANRVLKPKGILKIAEVGSRFPRNDGTSFVKRMKKFGFVNNDKVQEKNSGKGKRTSGEVFLLFEFKKMRPVGQTKGKLPTLPLSVCTYKKR